MDDDSNRYLHSYMVAVIAGFIAGLVHTGIIAVVGKEAIGVRGMGLMLGSASLALGWGMGRVLERYAGFCGRLLLGPLTLAALIALATGIGMCDRLLGALVDRTFFELLLACVVLWGMAAFDVVLDKA
jgi:hypothetical protein